MLEHQVAVLEAIGLQLARVDRRLRRINRSALVRSPRSTIGVGIVLGVIFLWLLSLLIGLVVGLFMIVVGIGL